MLSRLHDHCSGLVATYIVLIVGKVDFHIEQPVFPPGLAVTDRELGAAGESGIGAIFQLRVELFAYMDSELRSFEAGFAPLHLSCAVSMTGWTVLSGTSHPGHIRSESPRLPSHGGAIGAMGSRGWKQGHLHSLGMRVLL